MTRDDEGMTRDDEGMTRDDWDDLGLLGMTWDD